MSTNRANHNYAEWCRTNSHMSESSQKSPAAFRRRYAPESRSRHKRETDPGPSASARVASAPRSVIRDLLRLRVRGTDPGCPKYSAALLPDIPSPAAKGIFLSVLQSLRPATQTQLPAPDNSARSPVLAIASASCDTPL